MEQSSPIQSSSQPEVPSETRAIRARLDIWALVMLSLVVLMVRLPAFFLPMNRDSGMFAYGGWRILSGELPYLHFWDNKLPGIFYINALAIKLFGASTAGLVIFQILYGLVSAWIFFAVARRFAGSKASIITALLFAFYHGCYGLNEEGNFTESYIALPVLLSVMLILNWSDRRKGYTLPFLAGALGLIAGLIKQPAALVIPALILFALSKRDRTGRFAACAVAAGAGAVAVAVVAWMHFKGLLPAAIDANLVFNRLYAVDAYTEGWSASRWNLFRGLAITALPIVGAVAGVLSRRLKSLPLPEGVWLLIPWFLLDLIGLAMGGRFYTHYFLTILPSSLILTGVFIDGISVSRRVVLTAAVGLFLFFGPVWSIKGPIIDTQKFPVSSVAEREYHAIRWVMVRRLGQGIKLPAEEIAEWVKATTVPSDTIYVWGYDPRIGFLSQRVFPSRYVHLHPLGATGFNREVRIKQLADDIEKHRPRFIIDQSTLPQLGATAPSLGTYENPKSTRRLFRLDGYEPVKRVVTRHYEPTAVVGGCLVYELRK